MAHKIREIMTESPTALDAGATVQDAARVMLDDGVGDVIVSDGKSIRGIVTDRDITIRAVAPGKDLSRTTLGDIWTTDLTTLSPEDGIDQAVRLMSEREIRRIPIVEGGRSVGVVSFRDLAIELDDQSLRTRDVSASLDRAAEVCIPAGDLPAATVAYEEALALGRRLLETHSESPEALLEVSVSLGQAGDVHLRAGDLAAASAAYEEALALGRHLLEAHAETPEALGTVASSLHKLGNARFRAGDQAGASAAYEEAMTFGRRVLEAQGATPEALGDISFTLDKVGDVHLQATDLADAVCEPGEETDDGDAAR